MTKSLGNKKEMPATPCFAVFNTYLALHSLSPTPPDFPVIFSHKLGHSVIKNTAMWMWIVLKVVALCSCHTCRAGWAAETHWGKDSPTSEPLCETGQVCIGEGNWWPGQWRQSKSPYTFWCMYLSELTTASAECHYFMVYRILSLSISVSYVYTCIEVYNNV